jgi:hypothetical protein
MEISKKKFIYNLVFCACFEQKYSLSKEKKLVIDQNLKKEHFWLNLEKR